MKSSLISQGFQLPDQHLRYDHLTDCEAKTYVKSDRLQQFYFDSYVITWHNHINTWLQVDSTGYVGSTYVELRTVVVVEWSVTTTFLL